MKKALQFEAIQLAKEQVLFREPDTGPDLFDLIKGITHDFFYQKFRIKSL